KPAAAEATNAETAKSAAEPVDRAVIRKRRRRRRSLRLMLPAWAVSLLIHVSLIVGLAVVTFSTETGKKILSINCTLVANPGGADELVKIWADPSNQPRDQAVGSEGSSAPAASSSGGGGGAGAF